MKCLRFSKTHDCRSEKEDILIYVMDGEDSLVFAMKDVYAHTKCPFIILIDEWDCLFRVQAG